MKREKLEGKTFGRLRVKEYVGKSKYLCECECGNEKIIRADHLRSGATKSCGCLNKELSSQKMKKLLKEKWEDEEYRQKMSEKTKKQWENEDYRQMMSEKSTRVLKEKWKDDEFRAKMTSEEFRKTISNSIKEKWKDDEYRKKLTKENSYMWKGGITPIKKYLCEIPDVHQWKKEALHNSHYKCQLTCMPGNGDLNVHHLYSFSNIVRDAHSKYNIEIKNAYTDYTEEELQLLMKYVSEWHCNTTNAIVLNENVHKLFHELYEYGDNTPEQYEEFKQRYLDGEFNETLEEMFNK